MLSTLSETCCDLQSWIEEAMVEIAIENEVNEECKELSLAMEVRSYADYCHQNVKSFMSLRNTGS